MSKGDQAQPSPSDRSRKEVEVNLAKEARLVRRAMEGDARAFEALYKVYLDPVYRYIYGRVENVFKAETLTSETFTQAVDLLTQGYYDWQGELFGAWLISIAAKIFQEQSLELSNVPRDQEPSPSLERNE